MELFKLLGTIVIEKGEALRALREAQQEGEKTESKLGKVFSGIGKGAVIAGKAIATGLVAGAGAVAGLATAAINAYGDYEQLVGGVETLFGSRGAKSVEEYAKMVGKSVKDVEAEFGMLQEAQSAVMENASNAYKTAGLSMNDYMETANGLAAALNQSSASQLESAALADQAIIDMADNAAKMGTSMESIQTAYAGFAKQNYTMLDNLKLGYGGTKEEMERLLKDAGKIANKKFDLSSFADVTEAIHVMQVEMGIAGTTAKEASGTIQGSWGMLKGAWSNLMVGLSDPEANLDNLINNVFESVTTFAGNLVPRITQVLSGIATAFKQLVPMITSEIPNLLNQVLPSLIEGAVALVDGLVAVMPGVVSAIMDALPVLVEGFLQLVTSLAEAIPQLIQPIIAALPDIMQAIVDALPTLIPALITGFVQLVMGLAQAAAEIIMPLVEALPDIIVLIIDALVQNLPAFIEGAIQLIMGLVTALPQIIQALIDAIPTIVSLLVQALLNNLPAIIVGLIQVVWGIVKAIPQIFNALYIQLPLALWKGIFDGLGKVFSGLGKWFGETFSKAKDGAVKAWADAKEKFNKVKEKAVSGFNDLKTKVGNKFNEAKTAAQQKWADAKEKFSSVKDKVVSAFSNLGSKVSPLFSKAKENATKTWSDVKGIFEKFKNGDIVGAFSDLGSLLKGKFSGALDLAKQGFNKIKQIGKDLISGLWNGINDKFSWLTGKIKGFAKNVTDKLKGFFGIKSPSRVFRDQIGKMLAEGVAVGITEKESKAVEAAEKMAKNVLDSAQKKLDGYKVYNELTLADEVAFWDSVRQQVKEGTDARLTADQKYAEAKKSLNDEILSAEKTLQEKLDAIAQKVTDRQNSLVDSLSAFGGLQFDEWLKTPQMIANLNDQVAALERYQTFMDGLRERIGGTALFEEIETWGVNALPNLDTLYYMADTQLNNIVELYDKKLSLAGNIASNQLKDETISETAAAYQEYETKCAELGVEVVEDTIEMESGIQTAFTGITQTVQTAASSIAVNIGEKIKNAIDSVTESLGRMMSAFETFGTQMNMPNFNVGNIESLSNPATFSYDAASGEFGGYASGNGTGSGRQGRNNQNSIVISYLQKIVEVLTEYFPQLVDAFDVDLCLDTGVLVGELVEPMNEALGRLSSRKERGL